ncbi:MAG: hypothetical protein ABEJ75_03525 [Candidatus Nanohaloarchaea archaeon]
MADRFEMFEAAGERADEDDISRLPREFDDCMTTTGLLVAVVAAADEKKGADIEVFLDRENRLYELVDLFNSMGLNCVVQHDPDESFVRNMAGVYGMEDDFEMLERDFHARLFMTREPYGTEFFRELMEMDKGPEYHRRYGEFLGLPEKDIEAFVYDQKPTWKRVLGSILGSPEPGAILESEALEKYGEGLEEHEKKVFKTFTFGKIRDTREGFKEALERARSRAEALEELGIDTSRFME